jgi:hypothetical protein
MTRLTTLTALWALGDLSLAREEGKLLLPEEAPEEVFQAIRPHKARVLAALAWRTGRRCPPAPSWRTPAA